MTSRLHLFDIVVDGEEIDFMGHANNASYLTWVQAATLDHWRTFAPDSAVDAFAWVAVKHEITYRKPAFLAERLTAHVKLERVQRESAFYEIVIQRGDEVIAEVKSRWCCLDARDRTPARLPADIIDQFV